MDASADTNPHDVASNDYSIDQLIDDAGLGPEIGSMQDARSTKGKRSISGGWTLCLRHSSRDVQRTLPTADQRCSLPGTSCFLYPLYTRLLTNVLSKRANRRI